MVSRTIGAFVIGLVVLGILLGWWFFRRPSKTEAFLMSGELPGLSAPAYSTAGAQSPSVPQPFHVDLKLPENINITVKKGGNVPSTTGEPRTGRPSPTKGATRNQSSKTSPEVSPPTSSISSTAMIMQKPPSVAAKEALSAKRHTEAGEHQGKHGEHGEITPELLEQRYKKYLHRKTQEFLRGYPVIR